MSLLQCFRHFPVAPIPFPLRSLSIASSPTASATVPLSLIKELRAQTGAPITAIKSALLDHDNNPQRAVDALRARGAELSSKRSARATHEGLVGTVVAPCGTIGALVELRCETDFVARTERFSILLKDICNSVISLSPGDVADDLLNDDRITAALADAAGALGEGVKIGRAHVLFAGDDGRVLAYAHGGTSASRIGALVAMRGAGGDTIDEMGTRVAMHVAASAPLVVHRHMLSAEDIAHESGVLRDAAVQQGKTGAVIDKIVQGKMQKWYTEVCLVEQEMLVEQAGYEGKGRSVAESIAADAGAEASIVEFKRFAIS